MASGVLGPSEAGVPWGGAWGGACCRGAVGWIAAVVRLVRLPGAGMAGRRRPLGQSPVVGPGVRASLSKRSVVMVWVVGVGALVGALAVAAGVATLRTGWILPTARRQVRRPRLHGYGAVCVGSSCLLQSAFYFLPDISWNTRFFTGNAVLFTGLLLLLLSQLLPVRRAPDHSAPSDV